MWKESYRIGIEVIDKQHRELFKRADALLDAIRKNAGADQYRDTIAFLKEYVVVHFRDEEAYQESIHYALMEPHKKAHRDFTKKVLDFEKRLEASGYDLRLVKELAGTLVSWLVYHVAGSDQRIAADHAGDKLPTGYDFLSAFSMSIREVLETLIGPDNLEKDGYLDSDLRGEIFIKVGLNGPCPGTLIFGFTKDLAFRLVEQISASAPNKLDEFVLSSLAELANIVSGNAIIAHNAGGTQCGFASPEYLSADEAGKLLELIPVPTGIAGMDIKYIPPDAS